MDVAEAIRQRRSIRKFRSDPIPEEVIEELLDSARLAPSGSNRQPWRFIVVADAKEKAKLRHICFEQAFIEEAPVVLVCCADLTAYSVASKQKRSQEFIMHGVTETLSGRFADPAFRESLINEPVPDFRTFITAGVANTYIAIEHIVLSATTLGLGTCWVGALGEEGEINSLFNLPDTTFVVAVLPIGYPAVVPPPRPRLALSEILLRPLPVRSK